MSSDTKIIDLNTALKKIMDENVDEMVPGKVEIPIDFFSDIYQYIERYGFLEEKDRDLILNSMLLDITAITSGLNDSDSDYLKDKIERLYRYSEIKYSNNFNRIIDSIEKFIFNLEKSGEYPNIINNLESLKYYYSSRIESELEIYDGNIVKKKSLKGMVYSIKAFLIENDIQVMIVAVIVMLILLKIIV